MGSSTPVRFGVRFGAFANEVPDLGQQLGSSVSALFENARDASLELRTFFTGDVLGRDDNDRNRSPAFLLVHGRDELEAVHTRHHQIEEDQLRGVLLQCTSVGGELATTPAWLLEFFAAVRCAAVRKPQSNGVARRRSDPDAVTTTLRRFNLE